MKQNTVSATASESTLLEIARAAARGVAPLWPLQHFVAVNPFMGLSGRHFMDACALMKRVVPGGMLMSPDYYRQQLAEGAFSDSDFESALAEARVTLAEPWKSLALSLSAKKVRESLETGRLPSTPDEPAVPTVASLIDRLHGTAWTRAVGDDVAKWCAAYYDERQSAWRMPWKHLNLYGAWRQASSLDASMEVLGLRGFRAHAVSLPEDPIQSIAASLKVLGVPVLDAGDYFLRLWLALPGWSGRIQYMVRENGMKGIADDSLLDLLAILLAYETALFAQYRQNGLEEFWPAADTTLSPAQQTELLTHYLVHAAFEAAYRRSLVGKLIEANTKPAAQLGQLSAQAVFCIDVRSEPFRRALESAMPGVETFGFAGFFGMAIACTKFDGAEETTQCPVLLKPAFTVVETFGAESPSASRKLERWQWIAGALKAFRSGSAASFSFMETTGLRFAAELLKDTLRPWSRAASSAPKPKLDLDCHDCAGHGDMHGIALEDQVKLATGALRGIGLVEHFAPVVLLCGHGSTTANNPYASSLDCGACGGNPGDSNARVCATILNRAEVRAALADHGIHIPSETWFVAGLHDTTTDDVTLFDREEIPVAHRAAVESLDRALLQAAALARRNRAAAMGLDRNSTGIDAEVRAKSRHWAEVRPEWGLAGNAAFIAAPRVRTAGLDLNVRAFLHGYRAEQDSENSILELIVSAPMVVANWINMQYYASTVNHGVFGAGTKLIHNVVAGVGACLGNGGDLQPGLPFQSLHDGTRWVHEPHRLNVLIEAPKEKIEAALANQPGANELIRNGWVNLLAIESGGTRCARFLPGAGWEDALTGKSFKEKTETAGSLLS